MCTFIAACACACRYVFEARADSLEARAANKCHGGLAACTKKLQRGRNQGNALRRYTDQEFDAAFIDVLRDFCHKYIQREGEASAADMVEALQLQVWPYAAGLPS